MAAQALDAEERWPTEVVSVPNASRPSELRRVVLPESSVPMLLREEAPDGASASVAADTDLVPDVYEGGFKLWEGARDLLEVLHDLSHCGELTIAGARILEAGCGAGLPGAYAMRLGARSVVMQDYNAAVLREVTMPTFRLNALWPLVDEGRVRFISGDWTCVNAMLLAEGAYPGDIDCTLSHGKGLAPAGEGPDAGSGAYGFDFILSAETIYSTAAAPRLWELVRTQLRPGGTALLAAKSYYFGVGGSVQDFKALVAAEPGFQCKTVRVWEDGASNRRECFAVVRDDHAAATSADPAEGTATRS